MASIQKLPKGKWRAEIYKKGKRKSKTFNSKNEARLWANQQELSLSTSRNDRLFSELLDRYMREVSIEKKGRLQEYKRITALMKEPFAQKKVDELDTTDFAEWRDRRMQTVKGSSVVRDIAILAHCFKIAINEWKWANHDPLKGLVRPKEEPPRDRLISESEIERLLYVSNWSETGQIDTKQKQVALGFLLAIETAMRSGEMLGLLWRDVDSIKRTAILRDTKNGTDRVIPLSNRAIELIKRLNGLNETRLFTIDDYQRDSIFRKVRDKAGIKNLHFHDTRHEAITRLAKKLDVLDLARMVGHKNINQLLTYYNESAENLAKKLD